MFVSVPALALWVRAPASHWQLELQLVKHTSTNKAAVDATENSYCISLCSGGLWPKNLFQRLESTARYMGLLLAPTEGFSLRAKKKKLFTLFVPILGIFCCSVVTSIPFSSNHSLKSQSQNFKNPKKIQKISQNSNYPKINL